MDTFKNKKRIREMKNVIVLENAREKYEEGRLYLPAGKRVNIVLDSITAFNITEENNDCHGISLWINTSCFEAILTNSSINKVAAAKLNEYFKEIE